MNIPLDAVRIPATNTVFAKDGVVIFTVTAEGKFVPGELLLNSPEEAAKRFVETVVKLVGDRFCLRIACLERELKAYSDAFDAQPWASDEPAKVQLDKLTARLVALEAESKQLMHRIQWPLDVAGDTPSCFGDIGCPSTLPTSKARHNCPWWISCTVECQSSRTQTRVAELEAQLESVRKNSGSFAFDLLTANDALSAARREIEILRSYGNKDCTAQADEALAREKAEKAKGKK